MKILNWNLNWAGPRSRHAATIREELSRPDLDLICLTEASANWLPAGGQAVEAESLVGNTAHPNRRKVMLWAREGFTAVDNRSPDGMPPGRFVTGVTRRGDVRVVGVCIPWHAAHVSTGRRDSTVWEEHVKYLTALGLYLRSLREDRILVVGDFNQAVPRGSQPRSVYEALEVAFEGYDVLTAGRPSATTKKLIDHLAASPGLAISSWELLPVVSDHTGWVAQLSGT